MGQIEKNLAFQMQKTQALYRKYGGHFGYG